MHLSVFTGVLKMLNLFKEGIVLQNENETLHEGYVRVLIRSRFCLYPDQ